MPEASPRPSADTPLRSPTQMELRFLDLVAEVRAVDAHKSGNLAFLGRVVVQASLPYRKPPGSTFVRRNGDYTLTLQAPPDIGLPYGRYPRLVLAYVCREALRRRSPEIRLGDSLTSFMGALGIRASGGKRGPLRRFRQQAARLFATTISCSWRLRDHTSDGRAEFGTRIAAQSMVWWTARDEERPLGVLDGGWLVLSQDFYREVLAHPVALDERVLRALTSSFQIDLYAWLSHRMARLHAPVSIRWRELALQFGSQEKALRNFRCAIRRGLDRIRLLYPELRYEVTTEFLRLLPSPPHVPPRAR